MKRIAFLFVMTFLLSSCASYINKIHRAIDKQEARQSSAQRRSSDPYSLYRGYAPYRGRKDRRPIKNPITYSKASTINKRNNRPVNKRSYGGRRRYKAKDLVDNSNEASLWAGENRSNYLFSTDNKKKIGDIIIVEVLEDLKKEISNELKRAFPIYKPRPKKKKEGEKEGEAGKPQQAQPPQPKEEDDDTKIYDKISAQVIEEVSEKYILIRGRKEVIFRKNKRFLEIQALISRGDIVEGDKIMSDKILENKIFILR